MVGDGRASAGSSVQLQDGGVTVTADLAALTLSVSAGADLAPGGLRTGAGLVGGAVRC